MVVDVRLILLCLLLTACSPVDIIKDAVMPSKGLEVETEIVAGDKQQEVATVLGKREQTNTTNQADNITQTYNTVQESNPWWWSFLGGLLVGWVFLPDGLKMAQKVRSFFYSIPS